MVKIKQIEPGLYEVNGKGVDTRFPGWGRNLTADEYQELQKFRIERDQELIDELLERCLYLENIIQDNMNFLNKINNG